MIEKYDSYSDTVAHIQEVRKLMDIAIEELKKRAEFHDSSKLEDNEKKIFDYYTPKLKDCTYGSEEYNHYLKEMKPALDHHYAANRHHPEHYNNGISEMNLIDLIEMICDWYAATKRHKDGDIERSLEINQSRFGYSDELKKLLSQTISEIKFKEKYI